MIDQTESISSAAGISAGAAGTLPGLWAGIGAVLLGGVACWLWLATPAPADNPTAIAPTLAVVAPMEIAGALNTMSGGPEALSRFRAQPGSCAQPLAWVAIIGRPGQPPAKIRLRSGNYFSPVFDLPETPLRIAVPYPAPYDTGQGELTVLGATAGATIALTPAWTVPPGPAATRHVTWRPVTRCANGHG